MTIIICKTTGLTLVFLEQIDFLWELIIIKIIVCNFYIYYLAFFLKHPVHYYVAFSSLHLLHSIHHIKCIAFHSSYLIHRFVFLILHLLHCNDQITLITLHSSHCIHILNLFDTDGPTSRQTDRQTDML